MQDIFVEHPSRSWSSSPTQGDLLVAGRQIAILNVQPGTWFSNSDQPALHRAGAAAVKREFNACARLLDAGEAKFRNLWGAALTEAQFYQASLAGAPR